MTRRISIQLAAVLAVGAVLAGSARADKYAGEFLELGLDARSQAMGGSVLTLANDASGGYWNPAALARAPRRQLLLSHAEQFGGLENYNAGAYVHPLGGDRVYGSAFAFTFMRLAIPDIQVTTGLPFDDTNGNGVHDPGEQVFYEGNEDLVYSETFSYNTALFSYGAEFSNGLAMGASLKVIRDMFDQNSAMGIGLDLGALARLGGHWTGAAVLRDATGTIVAWDTDERETIAPSLRLGAAWASPVARLDGTLAVTGELVNTFEGRTDETVDATAGRWGGEVQFGAEYWFREMLALRAGSRGVPSSARPLTLSAGAGLRFGPFSVDYAFVEDEGLDSSHRVSGAVNF